MPSLVVSSPKFTQSGIALSASSCVEQVNGLVQMQATYTIAASRQSQLDSLFYVDSQPPIHPTCISKSNLLTNRLYMVQRSVSTSNGFCTVNADYVGGLVRAGFRGYYLTEQFDRTEGNEITGDIASLIQQGVSGQVFSTAIRHDRYEISVEFVKIGQEFASVLPAIKSSDLARNWRATSFAGGLGERPVSMPYIFDRPYDQWRLSMMFPTVEESRAYQTPIVSVVTLKHRLD